MCERKETDGDVLWVSCFDSVHPLWLVFQISYASFVRLEVSRMSLPFYYQILPPEDNYIPAVAAIILNFGWKRVTAITEDDPVFLDVRSSVRVVLFLCSCYDGFCSSLFHISFYVCMYCYLLIVNVYAIGYEILTVNIFCIKDCP